MGRDRETDVIESDTSRDSEELNVLAARFGATEYELFGYQADDALLQDLFMEFLQNGEAPTWLRSYVRNRFQSPVLAKDNIKQSALVTTGDISADRILPTVRISRREALTS